MATMRDAVRALLEADATLIAILTGGIFDASELDREGLSVADLATDATTGAIKPVAVLRWGVDSRFGAHFEGEKRFFEIYFYEHVGFSNIESAISRAKALLHRKQVTATDGGLGWMNFISGSREFIANELGGASGRMAQFEIIYIRTV